MVDDEPGNLRLADAMRRLDGRIGSATCSSAWRTSARASLTTAGCGWGCGWAVPLSAATSGAATTSCA